MGVIFDPILGKIRTVGLDPSNIKMKKITGTLATVGNTVNIAHGVTMGNILQCSLMVTSTGDYRYAPVATPSIDSDFYYEYIIDGTNVIITTGDSATVIAGRQVDILITYLA